jgi:hypothetical protein
MDEFNPTFNRRSASIHPRNHCPTLVFDGPLTGQEIRNKVKAYRDLYGEVPQIEIRGVFRILGPGGVRANLDPDMFHADIEPARIESLGTKNARIRTGGGQRFHVALLDREYWPNYDSFLSMKLFTE